MAGGQRRRAAWLRGSVWVLLSVGMGLGRSRAHGGEAQGPGYGPDQRPQHGPAAVLRCGVLCRELDFHFLVQPPLVVGSGGQSPAGEDQVRTANV